MKPGGKTPFGPARTRSETEAVPENAALLDALAGGNLDTDELEQRTRQNRAALSQRLQRLKRIGLVRVVCRRKKRRSVGDAYVAVWARATPEERRREASENDLRIAGRITIGRGARWGASLV